VVRAGYAIYHDSSWDQGGQGLWQNPPYYAEVDPDNFAGVLFPSGICTPFGSPNCGLQNGFLNQGAALAKYGPLYTTPVSPGDYSGTIQSQNRNFKQGVVQQFNLNIERQMPGNVVVTAGYAGSRSAHILVGQVNENVNDPNACSDAAIRARLHARFADLHLPYAGYFQSVVSNNSIGSAATTGSC